MSFMTPELHGYLFKFIFKYYKPNNSPAPYKLKFDRITS